MNHLNGKRNAARATGIWAALALGALGISGCKGLFGSDDEPAAAASIAGSGALPAAAPAESALTQAAKPGGSCPAGRWKYDYSDQALEVMMKNTVAGKVVEEKGEFICTVDQGTQGNISCSSQGEPVVNVIETTQAGIPVRIRVEIEGSATTRFTLEQDRMKVVSGDTSKLKVKANVNLAGKDVPFPTQDLFTLFGKGESTLSYKCDGGVLAIKPEVAGVETTWQEFTPAK